jgi:hypothetical protein
LRRLDSVLPGPVDLLKIDVEGYEGHVLAGARGLLARERPILFLELHPGAIAAPYGVAGIVAELAEVYTALEAFVPVPEATLPGKLRARYGGRRAVARVRDLPAFLAAATEGRRNRPFWLVCRPKGGGS